MHELTPAAIGDLYVEQKGGHSAPRGEPHAQTILQEWTSAEPEKAWQAFVQILQRRGDDEMLEQLWYEIRLLLFRHFAVFRERATSLFERYPRLKRIGGPKALNPAAYEHREVSREELVAAYLRMHAAHDARSALDSRMKSAADGALTLAVEIIHRGTLRGWESNDLMDPLQELLVSGGDRVMDEVERIARDSMSVRRCLWRIKRSFERASRAEVRAELLKRIETAAGTTTDYTDDDAPLPEPVEQSALDEELIAGWFEHEENFWAFWSLHTAVDEEPLEAWEVTLSLLESAPDDWTVAVIAADPFENLIRDHPALIWPKIAALAPSHPRIRRALEGIYIFEEDEAFADYERLMADLKLL